MRPSSGSGGFFFCEAHGRSSIHDTSFRTMWCSLHNLVEIEGLIMPIHGQSRDRPDSWSPFYQTRTIMSATTDKWKGNWNQVKGKLKEKYADLTDNDLLYAEGKEDQLVGRLQERLGQSKEEVHSLLEKLGTPTDPDAKRDDDRTA